MLVNAGMQIRDTAFEQDAIRFCILREDVHNWATIIPCLVAHDPGLLELKDARGRTPILNAIGVCKPSVALTLLEQGADPMVCDGDGVTMLHMPQQPVREVKPYDRSGDIDKEFSKLFRAVCVGILDGKYRYRYPASSSDADGAGVGDDSGDGAIECRPVKRRRM
jgi:hypothetical protein